MRDAKIEITSTKDQESRTLVAICPQENGDSLGAAAPTLGSPYPPLTRSCSPPHLPQPTLSLTGRPSFTASTGCRNGHANWCFHRAFITTLCRYCSWFVTRPGFLGLDTSGGGGLAGVSCKAGTEAIVGLSNPSYSREGFLILFPGAAASGPSPSNPAFPSPGSL